MRQHTINLYKFSELSSDAQRRAIEHVQSWPDLFGWCDEWRESLKAFCGHFNVTLKEWEVSTCSHSYADTDAENSHFRGLRLSQCDRDYMPTGFCGDCDFFMTFYDELMRYAVRRT